MHKDGTECTSTNCIILNKISLLIIFSKILNKVAKTINF